MKKLCIECGVEKDIAEFYRHKQMADGHLNKCKPCIKAAVNAHRLANIDRFRAYDRARAKNPARAKDAAAVTKRWRKADSRRLAAHNAVARALKAGKIEAKPCEWLGCVSTETYAHHESYDKPLTLVWYCQPHHKARHKQMVLADIDP